MQTGDPVPHSTSDTRHAPSGVQSTPCAQTQAPPPSQARFVPQVVPATTGSVVGVQMGDPDPHSIRDWVQAFSGVQSAPWAQTQVPAPSQARPVPQDVPCGSAVCAQVGPAVGSQTTAPLWQASLGGQEAPASQVQRPALQTRNEPHATPSVSGTPVSTHTELPVLQLVCHTVQDPAGVQSTPAVQATQVPVPLQTWFSPQLAPAPTGAVVAVQTGLPVVQAICDWTQAPSCVQSCPWTQATH